MQVYQWEEGILEGHLMGKARKGDSKNQPHQIILAIDLKT